MPAPVVLEHPYPPVVVLSRMQKLVDQSGQLQSSVEVGDITELADHGAGGTGGTKQQCSSTMDTSYQSWKEQMLIQDEEAIISTGVHSPGRGRRHSHLPWRRRHSRTLGH